MQDRSKTSRMQPVQQEGDNGSDEGVDCVRMHGVPERSPPGTPCAGWQAIERRAWCNSGDAQNIRKLSSKYIGEQAQIFLLITHTTWTKFPADMEAGKGRLRRWEMGKEGRETSCS